MVLLKANVAVDSEGIQEWSRGFYLLSEIMAELFILRDD